MNVWICTQIQQLSKQSVNHKGMKSGVNRAEGRGNRERNKFLNYLIFHTIYARDGAVTTFNMQGLFPETPEMAGEVKDGVW